MAETSTFPPSFTPGRKWRVGFSVIISVIALIAIVVMGNFISSRHYFRFRWNPSDRFQLSPLTLQVLGKLTNEIQVVVLIDKQGNDLHGRISELLTEYGNSSRLLRIEYVDYIESKSRAEALIAQHGLVPMDKGDRIVFINGRNSKVVYTKDLSVYDMSEVLKGGEIRRTAFKGEQLFTTALFSVMNPKSNKAYFLQDHQEHSIDEAEGAGYLDFTRLLEENDIKVGKLDGLANSEIPKDCDLLIIAGPRMAISQREVQEIEKYLNQGGRLLALFSGYVIGSVGLEPMLAKWGIEVGLNSVIEGGSADQGILASNFGDHPIMSTLWRSKLFLVGPRTVEKRNAAPQSADQSKVFELVHTNEKGTAREYVQTSSGERGYKVQKTGKLSLAVAAEKGGIPGVSVDRGTTRIVAIGDSLAFGNELLNSGANSHFARGVINWLVNRELLLGEIGPQPISEYQILIPGAELSTLRWLLLGGFPGGALFLGLAVWFRRRK